MKISGNTILITGGTSGIGLALAEEFLKEGNTVIICGRRTERLAQIKNQHPAIVTKECDLEDEKQREELSAWTVTNYPEFNVLINNAGVQLAIDLTKPTEMERIRTEVETNFIAPVHLITLFSTHLKTKADAVIINISSGLAFAPIAFMPIYCATKAAVHSLTLSVRHQFKNTSVKVIEIAPPSTDTELGHERRADKTQTHGGIPIGEFLSEAMEGLKNDVLEIAVGQSKGLRTKREELFKAMNLH
jgi:uncharacterized oxidoreductase